MARRKKIFIYFEFALKSNHKTINMIIIVWKKRNPLQHSIVRALGAYIKYEYIQIIYEDISYTSICCNWSVVEWPLLDGSKLWSINGWWRWSFDSLPYIYKNRKKNLPQKNENIQLIASLISLIRWVFLSFVSRLDSTFSLSFEYWTLIRFMGKKFHRVSLSGQRIITKKMSNPYKLPARRPIAIVEWQPATTKTSRNLYFFGNHTKFNNVDDESVIGSWYVILINRNINKLLLLLLLRMGSLVLALNHFVNFHEIKNQIHSRSPQTIRNTEVKINFVILRTHTHILFSYYSYVYMCVCKSMWKKGRKRMGRRKKWLYFYEM